LYTLAPPPTPTPTPTPTTPFNPRQVLPNYPYIINEAEDIEGMLDRVEWPLDLVTVKPSVKERDELIEEMPYCCVQSFLGKSQFDLPCAEALLKLNKPHIAMKLFNRVLTRNLSSVRARTGLIKAYIKRGMYDEAKEELILLRHRVETLIKMIDKIIHDVR
jgi:hypothetical protein